MKCPNCNITCISAACPNCDKTYGLVSISEAEESERKKRALWPKCNLCGTNWVIVGCSICGWQIPKKPNSTPFIAHQERNTTIQKEDACNKAADEIEKRFESMIDMLRSGDAPMALLMLRDTWINLLVACAIATRRPRSELELMLNAVIEMTRTALHEELAAVLPHFRKGEQ